MAALKRGGSRQPAKPRPRAPAKSQAPRSRPSPRAAAYAPAKLRAAQGVGLRPGLALGASALVLAGVLVAAMLTGDRLSQASAGLGHMLAGQLTHVGFRLGAVHVEGASAEARGDILRATGLRADQPILDVDLNQLRSRVEHVGWVKQVKVVRLLPDTMIIWVVERSKAAVWQHNGHTFVVDDKGMVIPEADAGRHTDLPLVVGSGANETAADILPLVRARPRLMERLEALVRVDDRRWDIRMKDGGLIQLPANGEESALIQLDQLDQKARILELGFARIDLRDPELVAVRPRDGAAPTAPPPPAGV